MRKATSAMIIITAILFTSCKESEMDLKVVWEKPSDIPKKVQRLEFILACFPHSLQLETQKWEIPDQIIGTRELPKNKKAEFNFDLYSKPKYCAFEVKGLTEEAARTDWSSIKVTNKTTKGLGRIKYKFDNDIAFKKAEVVELPDERRVWELNNLKKK